MQPYLPFFLIQLTDHLFCLILHDIICCVYVCLPLMYLKVCLTSLQSGGDQEVCMASVDMIFDMVKMVATQAYR